MYWVEVTYEAKDNRITGINSFVGGETLDKYSNVPKDIQLVERKRNDVVVSNPISQTQRKWIILKIIKKYPQHPINKSLIFLLQNFFVLNKNLFGSLRIFR